MGGGMEVDNYQRRLINWIEAGNPNRGVTNMPKIPVSIETLATELEPLDEGILYRGICRSCALSESLDKNGNTYLTNIRIEIVEPDVFRGRAAFVNYML